MSSLFYGFEIAKSGLFASQKAIDVTAHNVANANTPGYTRQAVVLDANAPETYFNTNTSYGSGQIGSGVSVTDIKRMRDAFLDMKFRNENKGLGEWNTKNDVLTAIQQIFNEPSDSSIKTVIEQFFSSLEELSKNPESLDVRALVRERALALTDTVNHIYAQLDDQRKQLVLQTQADVDQINSYAKQIRDLNEQIYKFELSGDKANDLRDKRDKIVDELSKLININAYEEGGDRYRVDVGGRPLVDNFNNFQISYNPDAQDPRGIIIWVQDSQPVNLASGELKGLYDMVYSSEQGIPYYMDQLDNFAYVFARSFNEIHKAGFDLNGETNIAFFNVDDYTTQKDYAKVFSLTSDIKDPNNGLNKIAAAKSNNAGDNTNALSLVALRNNTDLFGSNVSNKGTLEDYVNSLISGLGVQGQQAGMMSNNQDALTKQIDQQRQQVCGVSLDEEMSNLVKFQHTYQAAARLITTIDQMLDTLINGTGIVGR